MDWCHWFLAIISTISFSIHPHEHITVWWRQMQVWVILVLLFFRGLQVPFFCKWHSFLSQPGIIHSDVISTYINTKMCVCFRVFLGHLESDWDTLWHKWALMPRNGSKTIKFQKKLFSAELLPFFYISLKFLCKCEERLQKEQMR